MFLGEFEIGSSAPFNFQALDGFGQPVDCDQAPGFEVYVNNHPMSPPVVGTMAKIDGQTGFYGGSLTLSAAAGFAAGNTYAIRIAAVIDGTTTLTVDTFRLTASAATALSASFEPPPAEPNQLPVEADNPFDAALINAARWDNQIFGQRIVVLPDGVTERTITAVLSWGPIETMAGLSHGKGQTLQMMVDNHSETGLSAAEFDRGRALARVPEAVGKEPTTKRIVRIISQDAAKVTYQVQ